MTREGEGFRVKGAPNEASLYYRVLGVTRESTEPALGEVNDNLGVVISAVLTMVFAAQAAKYFDTAEVV